MILENETTQKSCQGAANFSLQGEGVWLDNLHDLRASFKFSLTSLVCDEAWCGVRPLCIFIYLQKKDVQN